MKLHKKIIKISIMSLTLLLILFSVLCINEDNEKIPYCEYYNDVMHYDSLATTPTGGTIMVGGTIYYRKIVLNLKNLYTKNTAYFRITFRYEDMIKEYETQNINWFKCADGDDFTMLYIIENGGSITIQSFDKNNIRYYSSKG